MLVFIIHQFKIYCFILSRAFKESFLSNRFVLIGELIFLSLSIVFDIYFTLAFYHIIGKLITGLQAMCLPILKFNSYQLKLLCLKVYYNINPFFSSFLSCLSLSPAFFPLSLTKAENLWNLKVVLSFLYFHSK